MRENERKRKKRERKRKRAIERWNNDIIKFKFS